MANEDATKHNKITSLPLFEFLQLLSFFREKWRKEFIKQSSYK